MGTGANFTSIVLVVQRSTSQVHCGLGRGLFESDQGQNKSMHDRASSSIHKHLLFFVILFGVYRNVAKMRLDQNFQKLVS